MKYEDFLKKVSEMEKGKKESFFISKTSLGGRDASIISSDIAKKCKYPVSISIHDLADGNVGVLVEIL
ncbi:MAG TPA: hypothetical protein PKK54_02615 [bacterium]|nr:hypothetical protein [bacterium]